MRNLDQDFKDRIIDNKKLLNYGFKKESSKYILKKDLNQSFEIEVIVDKSIISKVIEKETNEEYLPVDIKQSTGEYVGKIKELYEEEINNIKTTCTTLEIFKLKQTKELIEYVKNKYNDDLEYLWKKFPNNAIWRNKINNKWYGAVLTVNHEKLGIDKNNDVEILDIRYEKGKTKRVIDNKNIFPGYHMNKDSWITIPLDGRMKTNEIERIIDNSYELSLGYTSLDKKVYEFLTLIPKGKVVTYKDVAIYLGNPGLARVVGNILHKNPDGDKYPCYKVLNSKGELAEAFVFGGANIQKKMLEKDGIEVIDNQVDLEKYRWNINEK